MGVEDEPVEVTTQRRVFIDTASLPELQR